MPNYPYDDLGTPLDATNLERLNNNYEQIQADIASASSASTQAVNALEQEVDGKLLVQKNEYTGRLNVQKTIIDNLVVDGDSSPEAAQARVGFDGTDYPTLKDRIDTEMLNKPSGSPRGVYATLAALVSAKPSGDNYVYVVTANGNWYYWNGSAWASGGIYQSTGVSDNSITPQKTTFFSLGSNIFDPTSVSLNTLLYSSSGGTATVNGYVTTNPIDVSGATNITVGYLRGYSFYNASNVFISGADVFKSAWTITVPSNAKTVRVCWDLADKSLETQQINLGSTLLPYEPYRRYIKNSFLDDAFDSERISEGSLTAEQMDFVENGSNLFNPATVTLGKFLYDNGFIASSPDFALSDFIEVSDLSQIIIKEIWHYCFYDANKAWISGAVLSQKSNQVVTVPSNAAFFRFSFAYGGNQNIINTQQVNAGNVLKVFEPYGKILSPVAFPSYQPNKVEIVLPTKVYGLVGEELNIYFDNILSDKVTKYDFFVNATVGKQHDEFFRFTPTTAGIYPIKIRVVKDDKDIAFVTTEIHVKSKVVGNGVTKKIIIIGDSTTASGEAVEKLLLNVSTDVYKVQAVGTLGTAPNKHEGRSGWTALQYTTVAVDANNSSVTNAFWNPSTSKFDFSYYMAQNSLPTPDYVVLNLGINDTFVYTDDVGLNARIEQFFSQYDEMITSIRAFNANIKIGIALTIPPNFSQNSFARAYGTGQTRWRYKRNNFTLVKKLVARYDGRTGENLYLVPLNTNLDTRYNFPIDAAVPNVPVNARNTSVTIPNFATSAGVHPAVSGYWQIADVYWYWLKSFES